MSDLGLFIGIMIICHGTHIDPGVEPDIYVTISEEDVENKIDTILEKAIEVLSEQ